MWAYRDEDAPLIVAAEGFHLIDDRGRRYLDGHSSLWCNVHGHRVPEIDAALRDQLGRVSHSTLLGLGNGPSAELAAMLVQRAPVGLTKVFYADCGAAGVEVALKMAWQYHRQKPSPEPGRDLFACLSLAYHGDTVGTVSLGGIDRFHSLFAGLTFPTLRLPTPAACLAAGADRPTLEEVLDQTDVLLGRHADRIAAVVVEPLVQAAAGILVHPPGYLAGLRRLADRHGLLLIFDEIAVGFGRTGELWACSHEGVAPDILILSKGLTGGYLPLAAVLATEAIYEAFLGDPWLGRTFYHGHTYTGNPLACAAAIASLELYERRDVSAHARRIERAMAAALGEWRQDPRLAPHLGEIRHRGTMAGIDLLENAADGVPFPPERRVGHRVTLACRERGVILRNLGDTVVLYPAPAMPLDLLEQLLAVVLESFTAEL